MARAYWVKDTPCLFKWCSKFLWPQLTTKKKHFKTRVSFPPENVPGPLPITSPCEITPSMVQAIPSGYVKSLLLKMAQSKSLICPSKMVDLSIVFVTDKTRGEPQQLTAY
jgi:hypothetical protein